MSMSMVTESMGATSVSLSMSMIISTSKYESE